MAGATLCEPRCADFVAGAALGEPLNADIVAGAAVANLEVQIARNAPVFGGPQVLEESSTSLGASRPQDLHRFCNSRWHWKSLEIPQPTPVSKSFATLLACRYVHIVMAQCCQVIKLACGHACCHHASCYYTCPCSASMFVSHENTFCTNNLYLTSFPNQHAVSTASFPALFSRARQPTTSCSAKWTTQSSHVFRKPYQAPD